MMMVFMQKQVKLCSNRTDEEPSVVAGATNVRLNVSKVLGGGAALLRSFAVFGSGGCA